MANQAPEIFIIDDNEAVCHALKFSFDSVFNSTKVSIYFDPLIFLDQFSAAAKGCLLIDLFMPSLNGIDFLREIKQRKSSMQVIVMSGHSAPEVATQTLKEGAYAFFTKPIKMDLLFEKIEAILATQAAAIT